MSNLKELIHQYNESIEVIAEELCDEYASMLSAPEGSSNLEASNHIDLSVNVFRGSLAKCHESLGKRLTKKYKEGLNDSGLTGKVEEVENGSSKIIYDNEFQAVSVTKKRPASRLDAKKFKTELLKAGVDQQLIDDAAVLATVESKAATSIEVINKE